MSRRRITEFQQVTFSLAIKLLVPIPVVFKLYVYLNIVVLIELCNKLQNIPFKVRKTIQQIFSNRKDLQTNLYANAY